MRNCKLIIAVVLTFTAARAMAGGGADPSTGPSKAASGGAALKFTRLSIHDPAINNIEAFSFLIPAGWKSEGGMKWFNDYSILANLLMRISDPQTGATIEFLPIQNFTWLDHSVMPMQPGTNYMGNIIWRPVTDLNQFVQTFYAPTVAKQFHGARPVAQQELPKIEQVVSQQYGGQARVTAGRVRYEFSSNGHAYESDVYLTIVVNNTVQDITIWQVTSAYSFTAPKGQLDSATPLLATVVSSGRMSQDWFGQYMYVQQLFQNRMNQGIADAKAISDTTTRNSEEIRKMFADSYRQQQESQDRLSQSYSETIRGVTTYSNPYEGRPVELPTGYSNAWVNAQGEYILSNDAGYDPNVGDTHEWRQLKERGN